MLLKMGCQDEPLLPQKRLDLFEHEVNSDVSFIVGPAHERVPGHRSVMAEANPAFKAMLQGHFASSQPITIEDCDPRAFALMIQHLYGNHVDLQSVTTAMCTLYVGHKYMCHRLVDQCVAYLDANLSTGTCLEIYSFIRVYCSTLTCQSSIPSAPPHPSDLPSASPATPPYHSIPSCDALHYNILQFIDNHGDEVLAREEIEDLELDLLVEILLRDTLRVSSEMIVLEAILRWCKRECGRRRLEDNPTNRRQILGDHAMVPRYSLMTPDQVLLAIKSGVLNKDDNYKVLEHFLAKNVENELRSVSRDKPDVGVVPLSARSGLTKTPLAGANEGGGGNALKKGKKLKDKKRGKSLSPERKGKGSKFIECLVGAISCIFD